MSTFTSDDFALHLLAETLFYDEEYEALGNVSLIDLESHTERFVASYAPDEGLFVIEEGTEWEAYEPGQPDDLGYALAIESEVLASFDTAEAIAAALLTLAREHDLGPSVTLLFEDDDVG